jgi:hypothetical protein
MLISATKPKTVGAITLNMAFPFQAALAAVCAAEAIAPAIY